MTALATRFKQLAWLAWSSRCLFLIFHSCAKKIKALSAWIASPLLSCLLIVRRYSSLPRYFMMNIVLTSLPYSLSACTTSFCPISDWNLLTNSDAVTQPIFSDPAIRNNSSQFLTINLVFIVPFSNGSTFSYLTLRSTRYNCWYFRSRILGENCKPSRSNFGSF